MNDSVPLQYDKIFNPDPVQQPTRNEQEEAGDERKAPVYVYSEQITFRINVALATRRPLLVRGPSGTGKSSLAKNAADVLGWRFYEKVITSRTQAHELLWEVDLLRRLHDAQRKEGEFRGDYTPAAPRRVLAASGRSSWRRRSVCAKVKNGCLPTLLRNILVDIGCLAQRLHSLVDGSVGESPAFIIAELAGPCQDLCSCTE